MNIFRFTFGDGEDDCFMVLTNATKEEVLELAREFTETDSRSIEDFWNSFSAYLTEKGFIAERYFYEEPIELAWPEL